MLPSSHVRDANSFPHHLVAQHLPSSPATSKASLTSSAASHQLSSSLTDVDTFLCHLSEPAPSFTTYTYNQELSSLPDTSQHPPPPPVAAVTFPDHLWVWQQKPALALSTCDSQPLPSPSLTNIFSHHLRVAPNPCPHPLGEQIPALTTWKYTRTFPSHLPLSQWFPKHTLPRSTTLALPWKLVRIQFLVYILRPHPNLMNQKLLK